MFAWTHSKAEGGSTEYGTEYKEKALDTLKEQLNKKTELARELENMLHNGDSDENALNAIKDACEVSKSTLSRFCRKIGLEDFQEMKDELQHANINPSNKFNVPLVDSDGKGYLKSVSEQVMKLDAALDYKLIEKLVREIYDAKNIILLGSMVS